MKDIAIRDGLVGEKYTTEVLLQNNITILITIIVKIDVQLLNSFGNQTRSHVATFTVTENVMICMIKFYS